MKIWVTFMNTETKRSFTRYFDNLREKEKYLRKMKYFLLHDKLILIEDSTDIVYERKEK
ncbi:hypothetical protein IKD56_04775 [bacterium]|nr:hypothetical protein [bacterium]